MSDLLDLLSIWLFVCALCLTVKRNTIEPTAVMGKEVLYCPPHFFSYCQIFGSGVQGIVVNCGDTPIFLKSDANIILY